MNVSVWIAVYSVDLQGDTVEGVFADPEKAKVMLEGYRLPERRKDRPVKWLYDSTTHTHFHRPRGKHFTLEVREMEVQ